MRLGTSEISDIITVKISTSVKAEKRARRVFTDKYQIMVKLFGYWVYKSSQGYTRIKFVEKYTVCWCSSQRNSQRRVFLHVLRAFRKQLF